MALFKFGVSGSAAAAAGDRLPASASESVEALRRRARHRLMGAVVLVFVAVVVFPWLFDSQPRPVLVDTRIVIADRQSTPVLAPGVVVPAQQQPAVALMPAASQVPAHASLEPGEEEVLPSAAAASSAPFRAAPAVPVAVAPASAAAKPMLDAQRAAALLEGRSATDPVGRLVVQVGAFAENDKVQEVRRKLEAAGIKTYVQTVQGRDGKPVTRVRVGPFDSRAEADKAAAHVRLLSLPASVILL